LNTRQISRITGGLSLGHVLAFIAGNLHYTDQRFDAEDIPGALAVQSENPFRHRLAISIDFLAMVIVRSLTTSLCPILRSINPYLALIALGRRFGEVIFARVRWRRWLAISPRSPRW
jgi:hypothetical protein